MIDIWLLILTIVCAVLMIFINIYLFVLYSHPDDNKDLVGWIGRIIVIAGSCVIWGLVLLLPLDVANSRGEGGGFNMEVFYQIMLLCHFIFLIVLIPITIFLYESDDEKPFFARLCRAICYDIFLIIIVVILTFIAWGGMKKADYVDLYANSYTQFMTSGEDLVEASKQIFVLNYTFEVPAYLFIIVFWIFFGWFLFVIFGGVGIIALPLDLILDYFYRPKPRSAREMAERKIMLRRRVEELMSYVEAVEMTAEDNEEKEGFFKKWKGDRKLKNKENKLRRELYKVEQEYEIFEMESNLSANPILGLLKLLLGCFFMILSFMILIQIFFYKLIVINGNPQSEFLNDFFVFLEFKLARFISTIVFTGLILYVLFFVLKGNIKFGLRFLLCIPIHTMKRGRTFINSFLFNLMLVMLCTPAIIHFMIDLLEAYMRLSSGSFIFTFLVKKMKFFSWFYENNVFYIVFLIFGLLTFIYLMCRPQNDRLNIKKMIEERKKQALN